MLALATPWPRELAGINPDREQDTAVALRARGLGRLAVCLTVPPASARPRLTGEIETLSERSYIWSDRQKARAGAIVSVDHDAKLAVLRGLIRPEDMKPISYLIRAAFFALSLATIPPVANAASSVAHNAPVPVQQDWSNG